MTPTQQTVLSLIKEINIRDFDGWFLPSEVMAFVDVESSFVTDAVHVDRVGLFSVGLMQVENTTARDFHVSDPMLLKQPMFGLQIGMRVARANWELLRKELAIDEPSYEEWSAAYNEGVGNVVRGRTDDAYVNKWLRQQEFWASVSGVDDDA